MENRKIKMKIYDVEIKKVNDYEVTLDGNLVEWDYDGAPDGIGLTYRTIGWHEDDHYADVEEILYEWLEKTNGMYA